MPFVEELWNNVTSPYKNWHKNIKWFSIFIKPNKCQKIEKKNKREKRLPGLTCSPCAAQRPSRLAQPAGGPAQLPGASSSSCQ